MNGAKDEGKEAEFQGWTRWQCICSILFISSPSTTQSIRPESFDCAQDRPVEGFPRTGGVRSFLATVPWGIIAALRALVPWMTLFSANQRTSDLARGSAVPGCTAIFNGRQVIENEGGQKPHFLLSAL